MMERIDIIPSTCPLIVALIETQIDSKSNFFSSCMRLYLVAVFLNDLKQLIFAAWSVTCFAVQDVSIFHN